MDVNTIEVAQVRPRITPLIGTIITAILITCLFIPFIAPPEALMVLAVCYQAGALGIWGGYYYLQRLVTIFYNRLAISEAVLDKINSIAKESAK